MGAPEPSLKAGVIFPQTECGTDVAAIGEVRPDRRGDGLRPSLRGRPRPRRRSEVPLPPVAGHVLYEAVVHEALTLMAYLAAITHRLTLATGILILPQRQTALVAKQGRPRSTCRSGGPAALSASASRAGNAVEFEALDETFENRGRRSAEQVAVLRAPWSSAGRGTSAATSSHRDQPRRPPTRCRSSGSIPDLSSAWAAASSRCRPRRPSSGSRRSRRRRMGARTSRPRPRARRSSPVSTSTCARRAAIRPRSRWRAASAPRRRGPRRIGKDRSTPGRPSARPSSSPSRVAPASSSPIGHLDGAAQIQGGRIEGRAGSASGAAFIICISIDRPDAAIAFYAGSSRARRRRAGAACRRSLRRTTCSCCSPG